MIFSLSLAYLRSKPLNTILQTSLMALGVMMISVILLFNHQMHKRLYQNGAGIDLVIGAKGSALQLVLSSIQYVDIPTGNIDFDNLSKIQKQRDVKKAIPIALGDNYRGFKIVGTNEKYLKHFNAKFRQGQIWQKPMQAVIGAKIAKKNNFEIGDNFIVTHGFSDHGDNHDNKPYNIVGILQPANNILDNLILTSLESVWQIHHHEDEHDEDKHHENDHDEDYDKEITAILISYSNRLASFSFPNMINQQTNMQAASPSFEMARLIKLAGIGTNSVKIFGFILISAALISVFIGLLNNINDRRYDLAIFRVLGAQRRKILLLVISEGMIITIIGTIIGLFLSYLLVIIININSIIGVTIEFETILIKDLIIMLISLIILSFIACLIPAMKAYKTNIVNTLNNG